MKKRECAILNKEYKYIRKYYIPFTEYHSNFKTKIVNNKITKDPIKDSKNKSRLYYVNKGKIKYGKNQLDGFKNIYVLIGEASGSAADTFAAIMKSVNHAVSVGQLLITILIKCFNTIHSLLLLSVI